MHYYESDSILNWICYLMKQHVARAFNYNPGLMISGKRGSLLNFPLSKCWDQMIPTLIT